MSEMGDDFRSFKEYKREVRQRMEPKLAEKVKKDLEALGWTVDPIDSHYFELIAPNHLWFKYWFFKQYFQQLHGPNHGHGFKKLVELGKDA